MVTHEHEVTWPIRAPTMKKKLDLDVFGVVENHAVIAEADYPSFGQEGDKK